MITREDFLKALNVVEQYKKQIKDDLNLIQLLPGNVSDETSLLDIEMSNRTLNVLAENGIRTIGQLIDCPKNEYQRFRNIGAKSFIEIEKIKDRYLLICSLNPR